MRWLLLAAVTLSLTACFVTRKPFVEPTDEHLVEYGTYRQLTENTAFPPWFKLTEEEMGYTAEYEAEGGALDRHHVDMVTISGDLAVMQVSPRKGGKDKLWHIFVLQIINNETMCFYTKPVYLSEDEKETYIHQFFIRDRAYFRKLLHENSSRILKYKPDLCYIRD